MNEKIAAATETSKLVKQLADVDAVVREKAREQLIQLGTQDITRALLQTVIDPRTHVRWEAAKALQTLANPVAAAALMHALEDEDADVRWVAAEGLIALHKVGLRTVLSGLITRAGSIEFRKSAHHVLHELKEFAGVVGPVIGLAKSPHEYSRVSIKEPFHCPRRNARAKKQPTNVATKGLCTCCRSNWSSCKVTSSNPTIRSWCCWRDAIPRGKDGVIKRIVQHLSPRETRVVALGKPSDRDRTEWYFQRYTPYLPAAQEMVLFNRRWYNRAGVERVMGFCSDEQYHEFLETVTSYEQLLVRSGIKLVKCYLDIDRKEQKRRLEDRRQDPLKQWKISPIDSAAQKHWDDYSKARNIMFSRTHHPNAPWTVVRANDKRAARLSIIKDLLFRLQYKGKDEQLVSPDPNIVFPFEEACLTQGMIAP